MGVGMVGAIGRLGAVAGIALLPAAWDHADAATCPGGAISARFAEASRLCADPVPVRPAVVATPPTAGPAPLPTVVEVSEREAVSISMPGYRRRLTVAARETYRRGGSAPPAALVTAIAHRYRINPRLLASMMHAESAGHPGAISSKGALGLMQVMPATARGMGVRDPQAMLTDPVLAVSTGAAYLKRLQAQFGNNVPLVVAAYNAGPGAVIRAKRGIPRYRETQTYVKRVMGGYAAPGQ